MAIVLFPVVGSDGATYSVAFDGCGGSAANTPGGGLVQLAPGWSRYAPIALTSGSTTSVTNYLPDGTHQAVRIIAVKNPLVTTQVIQYTIYDEGASPSGAAADIRDQWTLAGGETRLLGIELVNGLSIALSGTLVNPILFLCN